MITVDSSAVGDAEALFSLKRAEDVDLLIASVANATWVPLGGSDGNYAQVNIGSDAADALIEKITNATDAHIELAVQLLGRNDLDSPRAAVEALFGVPGGQVEQVSNVQHRRQLAELTTVALRDGDTEDTPTIVVEDSGIGQHPDDFPGTLVSLNLSNKRDKFYLIGAYGWGGSAALAFSRYVVFISRSDPRVAANKAKRDEVGWTVVRFNDLAKERTTKTGVYEYLCTRAQDGSVSVPRVDPSALPDDHRNWSGTNCTLIDYQIGRAVARAAAFRGASSLLSLWPQNGGEVTTA